MKTIVLIALFVSAVFAVDTSSTTTDATTASGGTTVSGATDASGATTTAACADDPNTNCAQMAAYCSNPVYTPLLTQFCPVTCGFCPGATTKTPSTPCTDSSPSCPSWVKNGFCTNSFYNCTNRKLYCAKSCALCDVTCND